MVYKRRLLPLLVILAIVSATISPACAFISGQNRTFIEICNGAGLQTIPNPNDKRETAPDVTSDQCAFCFQTQTASGVLPHIATIDAPLLWNQYDGFINADALTRAVNGRHALAPPTLSSI